MKYPYYALSNRGEHLLGLLDPIPSLDDLIVCDVDNLFVMIVVAGNMYVHSRNTLNSVHPLSQAMGFQDPHEFDCNTTLMSHAMP